jgi:hypothetical protein
MHCAQIPDSPPMKRTETLKHIVVNSLEPVYDTIPDVAIRKVG